MDIDTDKNKTQQSKLKKYLDEEWTKRTIGSFTLKKSDFPLLAPPCPSPSPSPPPFCPSPQQAFARRASARIPGPSFRYLEPDISEKEASIRRAHARMRGLAGLSILLDEDETLEDARITIAVLLTHIKYKGSIFPDSREELVKTKVDALASFINSDVNLREILAIKAKSKEDRPDEPCARR